MKIFAVVENIQGSAHDIDYYWVEESIQKYFINKTLALRAIEDLLKENLKRN